MSKKRKPMSELPTMKREAVPVESLPVAPPLLDETIGTPQIEHDCEVLHMSFPVFNWDSGYVRQKLDVHLTGAQAKTLKSIQLGLEKQEAKLSNGRCVSNPVDAIRWMLEEAASTAS